MRDLNTVVWLNDAYEVLGGCREGGSETCFRDKNVQTKSWKCSDRPKRLVGPYTGDTCPLVPTCSSKVSYSAVR